MINSRTVLSYWPLLLGGLYPLGFAPFEYHTLLLLIIMAFVAGLQYHSNAFRFGFLFGLGLASTGLSWIYVSIHAYGHIHPLIAAMITALLLLYIALFYGLMAVCQQRLSHRHHLLMRSLLLASIWIGFEWARAKLFGGFPWLLLGHAAIDSPVQRLLPSIGIYGCGFIICWLASSIYLGLREHGARQLSLCLPIIVLLSLQSYPHPSPTPSPKHLTTSIIQANVAMLEKWDEAFFWKNYFYYLQSIKRLLTPHRLIILPEAAISAPNTYMRDELRRIDNMAKRQNSAVILGIPQSATENDNYYNGSMALGQASGNYYKQQLVPFGEYVPHLFLKLMQWLQVPIVNTIPGPQHQAPIRIFKEQVASLICYELAYPDILRPQVLQSKLIITMSDDTWFGHSLALYQHLQMARTLAIMSHRSLVFANNNGLSSLISAEGKILSQAPLWQQHHITAGLALYQDISTWVKWGDKPILSICLLLLILGLGQSLTDKKTSEESADLAIKI